MKAPTPAPKKPRVTLKDRATQFLLLKGLESLLSHMKENGLMNFLSGYKTYIVGAAMVLAAVAQIGGIDLPNLDGQSAGNLLMEAFAIIFLRSGIKRGAGV